VQERAERPPAEVRACARHAGVSSAGARGATGGSRLTATTSAPPGAAPEGDDMEGFAPATRFGYDVSPRR
jgi:hypothetical protein